MRTTGKIHAAKLERSPRLQRTLAALRAHPYGLTTRDVMLEADVCAVSSCVDELRENGYDIDCIQEGRIFRYVLRERQENAS